MPCVPVTVTSAASPTFTDAAWAGVNVAVAWKLPEFTIVITSDVEPALTDSPTERFTWTTVPLIGLVSWASARFCCAFMSEALSESIDA